MEWEFHRSMKSGSQGHKGDWPAERIKSAIVSKKLTMRKIAIEAGLDPSAVSVAIRRPWAAAQIAIAKAIGVSPATIWPSRYPHHAEIQRSASGNGRRGGDNTTVCPICKTKAKTLRTEQQTETVRKVVYQCANAECAHVFEAQIVMTRTVVPPKERLGNISDE
jgi:Ner family transcriptional regulator